MNNTPQHRENLGLWLGLLGVFIFGLTLPMTRLATGTVDAPQMSPWFVTWARAALAGGLSLIYLLAVRAPRPTPEQRGPLLLSLVGNVIGYPLLLGWALRHVTASHAAVITSLLPLATAAAAAWLMHQRARLGFWVFAALGSALVALYSLLRAAQMGHGVGAVLGHALGAVVGLRVIAAWMSDGGTGNVDIVIAIAVAVDPLIPLHHTHLSSIRHDQLGVVVIIIAGRRPRVA